jgi:hypothetical protein
MFDAGYLDYGLDGGWQGGVRRCLCGLAQSFDQYILIIQISEPTARERNCGARTSRQQFWAVPVLRKDCLSVFCHSRGSSTTYSRRARCVSDLARCATRSGSVLR